MKKAFSPPTSKCFPKYWVPAPCTSPLYSPHHIGNVHMVLVKAPLQAKVVENLPIELQWTCPAAVNRIKSISPRDCVIVAINLSKKNNSATSADWNSLGVKHEECRVSWKDPKSSIQRISDVVQRYRPNSPKQLVLAFYSGSGFNKTVFAAAGIACADNFQSLGSVLGTLITIHPPGIINSKVLIGLSQFFDQKIPFDEEITLPDWLVPIPDLKKPEITNIPLLKATFPGLQEVGATLGSRNDLVLARKLLQELDVSFSANGRITSLQNHTVWSEKCMQLVEKDNYRVSFQPEGDDVILIMFDKGIGFFLDSNGDLWNIPVRTRADVPLVMQGVLQKKHGGSFTFFMTDVLRCGEFFFHDDILDNRIGFIWNYIVNTMTSRPSPPTIEFVMRPLCLLKNSRQVLDMIPKCCFRCSGISFLPENIGSGNSIFLPFGECLVPMQAITNAGNILILYSIDEQTGEYVPVGISRIPKEIAGVDGMTVYANYCSISKNWVVKKYSKELQTVYASYPIGIALFRTFDPCQPQEILKLVEQRCTKQDDM